jgi:hypothetical protein
LIFLFIDVVAIPRFTSNLRPTIRQTDIPKTRHSDNLTTRIPDSHCSKVRTKSNLRDRDRLGFRKWVLRQSLELQLRNPSFQNPNLRHQKVRNIEFPKRLLRKLLIFENLEILTLRMETMSRFIVKLWLQENLRKELRTILSR